MSLLRADSTRAEPLSLNLGADQEASTEIAPRSRRGIRRASAALTQKVVEEAFRTLRSNLILRANEGVRTLLLASALPGEGKSTVSTNLACSLAALDKRVLVIDADVRRPSVHQFFQITNGRGLTDVLRGTIEASTAWVKTDDGPFVMPSGPTPADPQALLASPKFAELLAETGRQFDFVLLDSAPVLAVSDTLVLARQVDAVLMIMKYAGVTEHEALLAAERIRAAHGKIIGCVLAQVTQPGDAYCTYDYNYLESR